MAQKIQSESDAAHGFRDRYRRRIRYVTETRQWLIKSGARWEFDEALKVDGMIREFLDGQRKVDPRWKGSLNVLRSVKGMAERDPELHISAQLVDSEPHLVGTKTSVYDLERERFRRSMNGRYVTRSTTVDPDFDATCSRWRKFIRELCQGDDDLVCFLQRWCGYLLTGSVKEHKLLMLYGAGKNGKSVFVNTIARIMGSYHKEAAPETFIEGKSARHETAMAHLTGARFVTSAETDQGGRWSEGMMKRAVAGDPITTRFLYRNPFTYRPTFKVWISTNHLPALRSVDPAMRRRIHLLELSFVPKKPDLDLEEKLVAEHGAILAWMLEGTREWRLKGLNPPASVLLSTEEYFEEHDSLGAWLKLHTRAVDGAATPTGDLCASYNRYLRARNNDPVEVSYFGRQLKARGFEAVQKGSGRVRSFLDIRLKNT